jgi:nucleoside-diphosphate-sugar epimerase
MSKKANDTSKSMNPIYLSDRKIVGRILIAGGGGFIGSNLVDFLLKTTKYEITVIDNYSSGRIDNLRHLLNNPRLTIIDEDIRAIEPKEFESINYIFHLASRASPIDFVHYPIEILSTNSIGTQNLLDIAKNCDAKFILASTSEIYGDPNVHPQPETYLGNVNSIGERSPYNEGKRYAEAITTAYHRKYDLDTTIFRIFNTYGPNMRSNDGRVIPNFINQALDGIPFTIKGDGSQTRSFCFVSDLVHGLVKTSFDVRSSGEVLNIGNDHEISILDLAAKISEITNVNPEFEYLPTMKDEPKIRRPELSKIKNAFDWKPVITLDEGLKTTIRYFSKLREMDANQLEK